MIIVSVQNHGIRTPCQAALGKFICAHHRDNVLAVMDAPGKVIFNPTIKTLPDREWVWITMDGIIKPSHIGLYSDSDGYFLWPSIDDAIAKIYLKCCAAYSILDSIPYSALPDILRNSDLPSYSAGYGAGEGEYYCNIPGLSRHAYVAGTIPRNWIAVDEGSSEVDDGADFVEIPTELSQFIKYDS